MIRGSPNGATHLTGFLNVLPLSLLEDASPGSGTVGRDKGSEAGPKAVTEGLKIVTAKWIDQVLDIALERPLPPAPAPTILQAELPVPDGVQTSPQADAKLAEVDVKH